jgi:hypothetical protein
MHTQTYTLDQLAVLFQRSASTLRDHLVTLQKMHAFPERLPCFDNLWSRPAVDRWFEMNGRPEEYPPLPPLNPEAATLNERYGGR